MASRPCSNATVALCTVREVRDCKVSRESGMASGCAGLELVQELYDSRLFGFDGRTAGQGLVFCLQGLDQAIDAALADLAGEAAFIRFHQPRAQHVDVIDLPAGR